MYRKAVQVRGLYSMMMSRRYLRTAASRGDRRPPKFIRGKVTTLDDNVADRLGPVESYDELNRSLKRMFVDPGEIHSEIDLEEDDISSIISTKGKGESLSMGHMIDHDRFVRQAIIKKRFFKPPPETNLLTWAAKRQIRHLHQINPVEWTPERLSECFPISVEGAKRLLKNTFKHNKPEKPETIEAHDAEVARKWETLQSGRNLNSISPVTVRLWKEGKLIKDYYSGNVSLPQPPELKFEETEVKPKKVGEHLAIVKKYLDFKKQEEKKLLAVVKKSELVSSPTNDSMPQSEKVNDIQKNIMPDLERVRVNKSDAEDNLGTSFLATSEINKDEPDVSYEQFEQNITEEYRNKKRISPADKAYLEWLENNKLKENINIQPIAIDPSDIQTSNTIQKYSKENTIELTTEKGVAYLYDSTLGYQYPMGKENVKRKIRISSPTYKKGAVYKVGRCFYDDCGEFLYRLPFEIRH